MSTSDGDDVPRDPWGNPLPPEDRAPLNPGPDDYLPSFPSDPPGGAAPAAPPAPHAPPTAPSDPAWPGDRPTEVTPPGPPPFTPPAGAHPEAPPPAPPANPAWPGDQPTHAVPPPPAPPEPYPGQPHPGQAAPGQAYPGQPGPGWGGPGVPPQQPAYPPGQYPGWGQGAPWVPPKRDGGAIGALVCGIISITCAGFLGIILGPVALILGSISRRRIRDSHGRLSGEGMATWAIVLGVIGIIFSIVYLVFLAANPNFVQDMLDRFTTTTGG